jgi:FkbM family methyltransferase
MAAAWLRNRITPSWRAAIRRSSIAATLIRAFVPKWQVRPHPHCDCLLRFDGHRNIGWATGGLPTWELDYFQACARLFRQMRPTVIWDIGANVGIWTQYFARAVGSIDTVVAYEPDKFNIQLLQENVIANRLGGRVIVRSLALSSIEGEATFQADHFTGSTGTLERCDGFITRYYGRRTVPTLVAVSTIDRELEAGVPAPQFVKIDVEGHEADVFRGASQMLASCRPVLMVEFTGSHGNDAFAILEQHSYAMVNPTTGKIAKTPEYELVCIPEERLDEIRRALSDDA